MHCARVVAWNYKSNSDVINAIILYIVPGIIFLEWHIAELLWEKTISYLGILLTTSDIQNLVSIESSLSTLKLHFITDVSRTYTLLSLHFTNDCTTYYKYVYNIKDNLNCIYREMKLMKIFTVYYLVSASADFFMQLKKYFQKNSLGIEYISQSINCFSKLKKQTGNESWTGNKENTTCSFCIPNSKTAYLPIFMHSCLYKKALFDFPQTHKQGKKPTRQKETQGSTVDSKNHISADIQIYRMSFGWFSHFLL